MKKILIIVMIILLVIAAGLFGYIMYQKSQVPQKILTFEDCQKAGYLVVDTRPRECHTKKGEIYIEEDNHILLADYIEVTTPEPYAIIESPFKIEGKAHGTWFLNNAILVKVLDDNKKILATKSVYALDDTSANRLIPFVAAIEFPTPQTYRGQILVEKTSTVDNPGKNGPLVIPIKFKDYTPTPSISPANH